MPAPVVFIGHGNPMNAIEDTPFTRSLTQLSQRLEKPKAILVISAHWLSSSCEVSLHESDDALMYDMYGFPDPLYEVEYPAPNANFLYERLQGLFVGIKVRDRALDHGTWSVLKYLFKDADVPVMQFAIGSSLTMQEHFELGKKLRVLRQEGVMIIGSGNVTHSLLSINWDREGSIVAWAQEFHDFVHVALQEKRFDALINIRQHPYTSKAHPSIEHFIPLLYSAGALFEDEEAEFFYEKIEHGSLSMLSWISKRSD